MDIALLTSAFALAGAVLGAILSGVVQSLVRSRTARAERLESAIRSVAVALTARDVTWGLRAEPMPAAMDTDAIHSLERSIYEQGIRRLDAALGDVRRDLAVAMLDGLDVGDQWQLGGKLVEALPDIYNRLLSQRRRRLFKE